MNYQIIKDPVLLAAFIDWLPRLEPHEIFYVALFARRKYSTMIDIANVQLRRFLSTKEHLVNKIAQLECRLGAYQIKGVSVPQEALALYITVNPRDLKRATTNGLIRLATLVADGYKGQNPHSEIMHEVHTACTRKVWYDFDFDNVEAGETLRRASGYVNVDAIQILHTRGGFHLLVNLQAIQPEFQKTWHRHISALPGVDVRGDNLLPVPGCTQGDFTPYFMQHEG